jgi:hypothetical protein
VRRSGHVGELATVWLYRNDKQIKQVSYRELRGGPGCEVTIRARSTITRLASCDSCGCLRGKEHGLVGTLREAVRFGTPALRAQLIKSDENHLCQGAGRFQFSVFDIYATTSMQNPWDAHRSSSSGWSFLWSRHTSRPSPEARSFYPATPDCFGTEWRQTTLRKCHLKSNSSAVD